MEFDVPKPSLELCRKLAEDLGRPDSHFPIEKIHKILSEEYSYDQLRVLEAEFILEHVFKHFPELEKDDIDSIFVEKLYAIPAFLNQPVLLTIDVNAFYRACLVCNDIAGSGDPDTEVSMLPSRYIYRTFLAIDAMLPDDMEFSEMYLHVNIRRFIYDCHKNDDSLIFPPAYAYLQNEFFETAYTVTQSEDFKKIHSRLETRCEDLRRVMLKAIMDLEGPHAEDEYYLYRELYEKRDDVLADVQARLYRQGYYSTETSLLKMYADDTYDGLVVRKYIENLTHAYTYPHMAERDKTRKIVVVVDLEGFPDKNNFDGILAKIEAMDGLFETYGDTVYYVGAYPEHRSEGDKLVSAIGRTITKPVKILVADPSVTNGRLNYMADALFLKHGPPSRLFIFTREKSTEELESFKSRKTFRIKSGWPIHLI